MAAHLAFGISCVASVVCLCFGEAAAALKAASICWDGDICAPGAVGRAAGLAGLGEEDVSLLTSHHEKAALRRMPKDSWLSLRDVPASTGIAGVEDVVAERVGGKIIVALGRELISHDRTQEVNITRIYNPLTNVWKRGSDAPRVNSAGAATSYKGLFYYVGGRGEVDGSNIGATALWSYSPSEDRWEVLKDMPTGRRNLAAATVAGSIYAIGGRDELLGRATAVVERYHIRLRMWFRAKPLPRPRNGCRGAAVGGRIYVIGGLDLDENVVGTVYIYDPTINKWFIGMESMPTPRAWFQLAVVVDTIFAIGGWDFVVSDPINVTVASRVEAYDTLKGTWADDFKSMPSPRAFGGGTDYRGRAYVIGGTDSVDFNRPSAANEALRT